MRRSAIGGGEGERLNPRTWGGRGGGGRGGGGIVVEACGALGFLPNYSEKPATPQNSVLHISMPEHSYTTLWCKEVLLNSMCCVQAFYNRPATLQTAKLTLFHGKGR